MNYSGKTNVIVEIIHKLAQSIEKNKTGILLMVFSAISVAVAQLIWKFFGTSNFLFLILGLFLYGLSSISMVIAYRYGSLSVLHPILSMNYGFGILLSLIFLQESISWQTVLGVFIVSVGVLCMGVGDVN